MSAHGSPATTTITPPPVMSTVWTIPPGRELPRRRGKELYMQLWWCFNQMTRVCPGLRLWISRRFGMKVIDGRKKKRETGNG